MLLDPRAADPNSAQYAGCPGQREEHYREDDLWYTCWHRSSVPARAIAPGLMEDKDGHEARKTQECLVIAVDYPKHRSGGVPGCTGYRYLDGAADDHPPAKGRRAVDRRGHPIHLPGTPPPDGRDQTAATG